MFIEIEQTGAIILRFGRQHNSPSSESVENLETGASRFRICIQRDSSDVIIRVAQDEFAVIDIGGADRQSCGERDYGRNSDPLHSPILLFQAVYSRRQFLKFE